MNETDHKALTLLVETIYPYQPRYLSIPFSWAKRKLMKATGLNRWDVDKWLIDLHDKAFDGNTFAFIFLMCGPYPTSRLNCVSSGKRNEYSLLNSFCFLQFDMRNKYMKAILAELGRRDKNVLS